MSDNFAKWLTKGGNDKILSAIFGHLLDTGHNTSPKEAFDSCLSGIAEQVKKDLMERKIARSIGDNLLIGYQRFSSHTTVHKRNSFYKIRKLYFLLYTQYASMTTN